VEVVELIVKLEVVVLEVIDIILLMQSLQEIHLK